MWGKFTPQEAFSNYFHQSPGAGRARSKHSPLTRISLLMSSDGEQTCCVVPAAAAAAARRCEHALTMTPG